jgi:hypothetical protein
MLSVRIPILPSGPLDAPRWDTVLDVEASEEGSTGVLFIVTAAGSYVLKASSRPAEELFATLAFRELGIHAPRARVVGHTEQEWADIKQAIRAGVQARYGRGDAVGASRVRQRLRGPLDRPQILIMEMVPRATPLEGHPRAAALLESGGDGGSRAAARGRLRALGRVLVTDIVLNNSDRIMAPCWDNDGNGGNLLLLEDADADTADDVPTAGLVPIDSVVTALQPTDSRTGGRSVMCVRYVTRARALLAAICGGGGGGGIGDDDGDGGGCNSGAIAALEQVRGFVRNNTGLALSDAALEQVRLVWHPSYRPPVITAVPPFQ